MSSDDFTLLDMINVLKWYELIPNEIKVLEQHARTKIKFQGLLAIHEDSSEILVANLAEDIQLKFGNASFQYLQKARSLLVNRTARTNEEIKVLSQLIQKVDEKMEEAK